MGSTRNQSWKQSLAARIAGAAALARGRARPFLLVFVLVVGFVAGAFYVRHRWPETVAGRHSLTAEQLVVTPQPRWIHGDVKAEVIRDAQLSEMDLFDRNLTSRIADAFAVHTWVAEVKRVSKHAGGGIEVRLVYRRPMAMVEVVAGGRPGLLPVDEQGVLLPPEDFSPNQARDYLRIAVADSKPAGPVGTSWGDPRVIGAARIAAAWRDANWKKLGLYRIEVEPGTSPSRREASYSYAIYTKQGRRILWGRAPGEENAGEATASQKVARLQQHVKEAGALDQQPAGDLDLRDAQALHVLPRTARLQAPVGVRSPVRALPAEK